MFKIYSYITLILPVLVWLCSFGLAACSESDPDDSTQKQAQLSITQASASVFVADSDGKPILQAKVITYSDFGETIVGVSQTNDQGTAILSPARAENFSFAVVSLDDESEQFVGTAFYDVPYQDYQIALAALPTEQDMGSYCDKPSQLEISLSSEIPNTWSHQLYVNNRLVTEPVEDGRLVKLSLCESELINGLADIFMVSSPLDRSDELYSFALKVDPYAQSNISLTSITKSTALNLQTSIDLEPLGSYVSHMHELQPFFLRFLSTTRATQTVSIPKDMPETQLALSVGSDLDGSEHTIVHYFTDVPEQLELDPALQEPELSLTSEQLLTWHVEGVQPDYVVASFEDDYEGKYRMSWEIQAQGTMKTLPMPALPPEMSQFAHHAERQYFDIALEMNWSAEFDNFSQSYRLFDAWKNADKQAESFSVESRLTYLID